MKPYAPLGLLYLSSYLRAQGFDVEIFDSTFRFARTSCSAFWKPSRPPLLGHLRQPDDARAARSPYRRAPWQCGWRVDRSAAPSRPTIAERYLAAGADVVVAGEGELALEAAAARHAARAIPVSCIAADGDASAPGRRVARRSGRAALAGSRTHRYRAVSATPGASITARAPSR